MPSPNGRPSVCPPRFPIELTPLNEETMTVVGRTLRSSSQSMFPLNISFQSVELTFPPPPPQHELRTAAAHHHHQPPLPQLLQHSIVIPTSVHPVISIIGYSWRCSEGREHILLCDLSLRGIFVQQLAIMRIERPHLPTSKLLSAAIRGNKNGYYKANDEYEEGEPSSYSKSSRVVADSRRPLLLDVKEFEQSKQRHSLDGDVKTKMKKVQANKKISPPSPSQRLIKRGVVALRIDAIENGQECVDDDDGDDDSRYLLGSIQPTNINKAHTPKKSLCGFRLGSPRNKESVSHSFTSSESAVKRYNGTRIVQSNFYRNVDEATRDDATEIVDLGGFDILCEKPKVDNADKVIDSSASSDKENDGKSLTSSSSTIDLDSHLPIEKEAESVPHCEVDVVDADTILADLADTQNTPIHTPMDESVSLTTATVEVKQPSSCVTHATTYSNYHRANTNTEKPFHVVVTPTENGDVILLSASVVPPPPSPLHTTTTMDSTLQKEPTLFIPALEGRDEADETDDKDEVEQSDQVNQVERNDDEEQDKRVDEAPPNVNITPVEPESRKKMVSFSIVDKETSSPTGVDELDMYEETETSTHEIAESTSDDFVANEGWEEEEDDTNTQSSSLSRAFGSFEVHEDAMRAIGKLSTVEEMQHHDHEEHHHTNMQQNNVIELRHSMESDCDDESQSSSSYLDGADLLGSDTQSIELVSKEGEDGADEEDEENKDGKEDDELKKDEEVGRSVSPLMANDEIECNESRGTGTTLGSFSQIYMSEGQMPDGEESDSECDESASFLEQNDLVCTPEKSMLTVEPLGTSSECGEVPSGDVIDKSSMRSLAGSKPWAIAECDSESVYSGADLISVPSKTSIASNDEQEILAPSSSMLSVDPHSVSTGDRDHENFESLNSFWVREWTEAVTKLTSEAKMESVGATTCKESMSDSTTREPRLLLKKDVGDAMSDDDNDHDTTASCNICSDGEGNQYLKIYDIDTCTDVYEVIQFSGHELETVLEEESCSEEDVEGDDGTNNDKHRGEKSLLLERLLEESVEAEMQKLVGSPNKEHQAVAPTLDELQRMFDAYQATQGNQFNASVQTLSSPSTLTTFRSAKSSKKRHVHIKRRAIAKAKAEKTKYDLVYVEKGSHRDVGLHRESLSINSVLTKESVDSIEAYSNVSNSSVGSNMSLDGLLSKAMQKMPELVVKDEDDINPKSHFEDSIVEDDRSGKVTNPFDEERTLLPSGTNESELPIHCDISEMDVQGAKIMHSIEDDYSLGLGSNLSLDGIIAKAISTMPEFLFEDEDYEVPAHNGIPKMEVVETIQEENSLASSVSFDSFTTETDGRRLMDKDDPVDIVTRLDEFTSSLDQPKADEDDRVSSVLTKLYDENNELAESLAAVQRELEHVNRKLAVVTHERDEVVSSAC